MTPFRALLCLALGITLTAVGRAAPDGPAEPPPVPTVIESDVAEMVSTETETTFTFGRNVVVTATNMQLTCDELVVVARRSGDPTATIGKPEKFKSMVATGNVRIVQDDREATCGRAEVFPDEDKVVLTENPRVRTLDGTYDASGPRMVLERGERRARIEGIPGQSERPRILLPPLKDLGYEKEPSKEDARAPSTAAPDPSRVRHPAPPSKK
jgi:lipopolysaccharide export system protein LptA